MNLEGRVALVTGAAQGIGRAIALALAEAGADIAGGDVKLEQLQAVAKEIEARGEKAWRFPWMSPAPIRSKQRSTRFWKSSARSMSW